jgi:hypothetical protein
MKRLNRTLLAGEKKQKQQHKLTLGTFIVYQAVAWYNGV